MPCHRHSGVTVALNQYDIVGNCARNDFVRHVALAEIGGTQIRECVVVSHMGPPLEVAREMRVDASGTVGLDEDERQVIERFAKTHAGQHASFEIVEADFAVDEVYCIHPHKLPYLDSNGGYVRTRFSCVGFVYEAYKRAEIPLLVESSLPPVDLDTLKTCYPSYKKKLDTPYFRDSMGLSDNGPWPVMLCGYLVHSLNRAGNAIRSTPYAPRVSDVSFP